MSNYLVYFYAGAGKPESPNQRELNSMSLKNIQLEKIESRNKVRQLAFIFMLFSHNATCCLSIWSSKNDNVNFTKIAE